MGRAYRWATKIHQDVNCPSSQPIFSFCLGQETLARQWPRSTSGCIVLVSYAPPRLVPSAKSSRDTTPTSFALRPLGDSRTLPSLEVFYDAQYYHLLVYSTEMISLSISKGMIVIMISLLIKGCIWAVFSSPKFPKILHWKPCPLHEARFPIQNFIPFFPD